MTWRFGVLPNKTYVFPTPVETHSDNFTNAVTQTVRMPGVHGGFDSFGNEDAPAAIGSVPLTFRVRQDWAMYTYSESDPAVAMQKARNAINAMRGWGKTKLFKPAGDEEWFCYARVDNISMPENEERNTGIWLPVSMTFHVPLPFWFQIGTEAPNWGEVLWGQFEWGGTAQPIDLSGLENDFEITRVGNAPTYPRIEIIGRAPSGITSFTLQRVVDAVVVDELAYDAALAVDDSLEIDCRARTVKLNGVNAYTSAFEYATPEWMELEPGVNSLRLLMGSGSDEARIYMRYYEAYR